MVRHNSILFKDFESILQSCFHSFPDENRPPTSLEIRKKGTDQYLYIQMALAGFVEDDIKVWSENNVLYISGDNTANEDLQDKFKMSFMRQWALRKDLDSKKAQVGLKNGLLTIEIPIITKQPDKILLFGQS